MKTNLFNKLGKIQIYSYKNKLANNINYAITKGKINHKNSVPVRVISTKIKNNNILLDIETRKNLKLLSRYKNFLLLIISKNSIFVTKFFNGEKTPLNKFIKSEN